MEIILLRDVAKIGKRMQICSVSDGYAINFLIPKGLAKAATAGARKDLETQKTKTDAEARVATEALAVDIKKVDGKSVTLHEKANEQGHLFATIHKSAIQAALNEQLGVSLPEDVLEDKAIKETGTHPLLLQSENTKGTLNVVVEAV
ncbi:MAG: 50S ribosomal protein L9 [Patescibacteria group bacterium]